MNRTRRPVIALESAQALVLGVLLALMAYAALGVMASAASAEPSGQGRGNSPNAKQCHKGGWEDLVRSDGTAFASEEECVSYAAQGGVLHPKPATTPLDLCKQALADAGLSEPAGANYIVGTEGNDDFTSQLTAGNDVICGFGGNDEIRAPGFGNPHSLLAAGDIFLGGDGDDYLHTLDGGTFEGGAGSDGVGVIVSGTFNGGDGHDFAGVFGGTFNGGGGNDRVITMLGGTFNGGDGYDGVDIEYCGGTLISVEDVTAYCANH